MKIAMDPSKENIFVVSYTFTAKHKAFDKPVKKLVALHVTLVK